MQKAAVVCCCLLIGAALCAAQSFPNIDDQTNTDNGTTGWGSCSDCAGGQNVTSQFSSTPQATPSLDGQSLQFFITSTLPYTNALWWYKLGPYDSTTSFTFDFWFQIDNNTTTNAQALEFDTFQFVNGQRFMFGTQCNYSTRVWQVWDEGGKTWTNTRLKCRPFTANAWHHAILSFHRSSNRTYYDSISIDGSTARLKNFGTSGPLPAGWGDNLGVQFQIDLAGSGGQATMWVDEVTLTAQ